MVLKRGCLAYDPPIIKIPNSRYTPWRVRGRGLRIPYSNDEVDSVAGQILFLITTITDAHSLLLVLLFTSFHLSPHTLRATPQYRTCYLDYGATILGHILVLRCHDTLLGVSGLLTLASGLIFHFLVFTRGTAAASDNERTVQCTV